jgi:CHAD domain-containing protein
LRLLQYDAIPSIVCYGSLTRAQRPSDRPANAIGAPERAALSLRRAIAEALDPISAPGGPSPVGTHQARRCLKRARAALRLMRPSLGDRAFADEDALLRGCARSMAGMRDADVLLETLAGLRRRFPRARSIDELAPLEGWIRARREAASTKPAAAARNARLLRASQERLGPLVRRPMSVSSLEQSMRAIYRRGRNAYARACATSTAAALHRLRKHAKYFANAVDALGDAATRRQCKRAKLAIRIGDWLGEHHDLAMLEGAVGESGAALTPAARRTLRALVAKRQRLLRRRAFRAGGRLYAAKARRVAALQACGPAEARRDDCIV